LVGPASISQVVAKISDIAWTLRLPLLYVHSVGFFSHFSVQLPPSFPIVDTHPDPASTQDLRILAPWPELVEYTKSQTSNLGHLPDHEHGHVPYLLLLLHYLEIWKESHEGKYPENYREKTEFRSLVAAGVRTNNAEGGEENFDEAVAAVLKSLNPPSIPSGLREILEEEECRNPRNSVK
jgi:NEDD8-activating enzyme E1 regulatory subunit